MAAVRSAAPPQEEDCVSRGAAMAEAKAERAAEDSEAWKAGGFPAYLQNEVDDFCAAWDDALQVRCSINDQAWQQPGASAARRAQHGSAAAAYRPEMLVGSVSAGSNQTARPISQDLAAA